MHVVSGHGSERVLLTGVSGATSLEYLQTLNGQLYATFHKLAENVGFGKRTRYGMTYFPRHQRRVQAVI
jgi:hypothetical protein